MVIDRTEQGDDRQHERHSDRDYRQNPCRPSQDASAMRGVGGIVSVFLSSNRNYEAHQRPYYESNDDECRQRREQNQPD